MLPKPAHVGETPSVQSPAMLSPVAEQPDQSARRAHFRPNDRQVSEGWYETKSQRKPHDSTNTSSLPRSKEGWINNSNSGLLNHVRRSLKDQGWTEGQGAGPRHSGISDPILPENLQVPSMPLPDQNRRDRSNSTPLPPIDHSFILADQAKSFEDLYSQLLSLRTQQLN